MIKIKGSNFLIRKASVLLIMVLLVVTSFTVLGISYNDDVLSIKNSVSENSNIFQQGIVRGRQGGHQYLFEDFSGHTFLPLSWDEDDPGEWTLSYTDNAGLKSPEANLNTSVIVVGDLISNLITPFFDTTSENELWLYFRSFIDIRGGASGLQSFKIMVRPTESDSWSDVTPWTNPLLGDEGPLHYAIDITPYIGVETRVKFQLEGSSGVDFCDWYLDDVEVIGGAKNVDPVVEWHWDGSNAVFPTYNRSIATPLVADLNNDNIPEIVFITYQDDSFETDGILRAVHGNNGTSYFDITDPAYRVAPYSTPAIGDIDRPDTDPEIVVVASGGSKLLCFEHTGAPSPNWVPSTISPVMPTISGVVIANLDNLNYPEIVVGNRVFNNWGQLKDTGGFGHGMEMSCVADVDCDGLAEIVAGNTVYGYNGLSQTLFVKYYNPDLKEGAAAIGDFDDDPQAEIVLVHKGGSAQNNPSTVQILEHDLTVKHEFVMVYNGACGNRGGSPPTVDDFNGDGYSEIGVAFNSYFIVFNRTLDILWWDPSTCDDSSGATPCTVYDLNIDGVKDVIYSDEETLRVYNGRDGTLQWSIDNPTKTAREMPVVADVDNDGHAEFVVVCNPTYSNIHPNAPNIYGLRVFGDNNDSWYNTRKIWNQHTYHITNVEDDAVIPYMEQKNWLTYNNYRIQKPPTLNVSKDDNIAPGDWVNLNDFINYTITFGNNNPFYVHNVQIVDYLSLLVDFIDCSSNGHYDQNSHTVTWSIGTLAPGVVMNEWVEVQFTNIMDNICNELVITSDETKNFKVVECSPATDPNEQDPNVLVDGPMQGPIQFVPIPFYIQTFAPDSDEEIFLNIDWGDETFDEWIGPYPANTEICIPHVFMESGPYSVVVQANVSDTYVSGWSDPSLLYMVQNGDANGDDAVNVGDAVFLINYIFKGGPGPIPRCTGDANGDGQVNVGDAVYLINYVFKGGPGPVFACGDVEIVCGDVNCDGVVDSLDVDYLTAYLYSGGPAPVPFVCVGDVVANGQIQISDIACIIDYITHGTPLPQDCCSPAWT